MIWEAPKLVFNLQVIKKQHNHSSAVIISRQNSAIAMKISDVAINFDIKTRYTHLNLPSFTLPLISLLHIYRCNFFNNYFSKRTSLKLTWYCFILFQNLARDRAGINKLRSWATLSEVKDLYSKLIYLYNYMWFVLHLIDNECVSCFACFIRSFMIKVTGKKMK